MHRQSTTAADALQTFQALTGTGAAFFRISSKKQEIKSQYEGVENWLTRRKAKVDPNHVFDFIVKRRKTAEHVDFKRLIEWVRDGRINWIVVQDLDRFGSKDPYQLMEFLGKLKEAGCQLWTVADDKCMNDGSDEAILMAVIKGMTSERECWVKSDRAHRTKQDMANDGRWLGGPIPYGFDVECRRDGKVVWRYILDKARRVEEIVKGHKTYSYEFEGVMIQDGEEKPQAALPPRNRKVGETAWLMPSLRADRLEALALIFQWYATEEVSFYEISKRLNTRGFNPVHGDLWYPARIRHFVENPVYQGLPSAYKRTQAGYYRYAGIDPETGARQMGKAPDKSGKSGIYDRSEWIGPKAKPFEPVVDEKLITAAVERATNPTPRKKAPKNAALWLAGLVVCDRCGKPMAGNMGHPEPRRKTVRRTYLCSTYMRHPGGHAPTGCRAHRVQHDVIEGYLHQFLETVGKSIDDYKDAHHHPEKLKHLLERNEEVLDLVVEYTNRMYHLIRQVEKTDSEERPYHRDDLEEVWADLPIMLICYEEAASKRRDTLAETIAHKEAEFDRMVDAFAGLTNERAREKANARMDALDVQIQSLRSELPGLDVQVRSLFEELSGVHNRIRETQLAMRIGSDQQKADTARRAVKEIRLGFRYENHSARVWSKLATVKIVPLIGESVEFSVREKSTPRRT